MNPNSVVLYCEAADAERVNAEVAVIVGDAEGSQNLSRQWSTDGVTVSHYAGHAWLTDEDCKRLSAVKGLSMSGAALDGRPFDHWLQVMDDVGARPFVQDPDKPDDPEARIVAERRAPEDPLRIIDARAEFVSKPDIVEAMKGEAAINKPAAPVKPAPVVTR